MDYIWFLFRFEGRINRAKYLLATLIILCCMVFALLLQAAIFGINGPLNINLIVISASIEPADGDLPSKASLLAQIVTIALTVFFAYCYLAVSVKRLHDRNKSGWWVLPVVATSLYEFADRLGGSSLAKLLGFALFIAFIWGLVEMYFRKGTRGPNRFGPDPLAPRDTRPRWEQISELEFVPHSAGPSPGPHVKRGA
jgi:uncharacterized membrane protein YhaH (DUF805 family)